MLLIGWSGAGGHIPARVCPPPRDPEDGLLADVPLRWRGSGHWSFCSYSQRFGRGDSEGAERKATAHFACRAATWEKHVFPPCCKAASLDRAGFVQTLWKENSLVLHRYACENRCGESMAVALKAPRLCSHTGTGNDFMMFCSFICFDF